MNFFLKYVISHTIKKKYYLAIFEKFQEGKGVKSVQAQKLIFSNKLDYPFNPKPFKGLISLPPPPPPQKKEKKKKKKIKNK